MSLPSHHNGSLWFDTLDDLPAPQAPDTLPEQVDVAIVGGGFTGLWTAYYLNRLQPDLGIAVFEAETVGFGASGRNGGWCMGMAMGIEERLHGPDPAEGRALLHAMQETVDEIGRVCQAENIDCHFAKGGTLSVATTAHHAEAFQKRVAGKHALGFTDHDFRWLDPDESARRIGVQPNFGAAYTSHCAVIHPARLVRGLGEVLRRKGVAIHERTPVRMLSEGRVETPRGEVRAPVVLRATEGYTGSIRGHARRLMPLYTMMIATEPLPEATWRELGLAQRETFDDGRRITIYGQRTLDGRLAFGGRVGYRFGSRVRPRIERDDPALKTIEATMRALLPALGDARVTHGWGGVMGVPRHGRPFVTFDRDTGLGAAGGYTGEGVGASNLAARTLTDLVLDRSTPLVRLAWVDDLPAKWPVEPFRWLGMQAVFGLGRLADRKELGGNRSRYFGPLFDRLF